MVTRRLFVVAAVLALAGCTIDKQNAPAFSGPSELSLAVTVTATPDLIPPDGGSAISVTALDASGNPVAGLSLRFRLAAAFGTLSATSGATDGGGRASVTYTAPSTSPTDTLVTIEVTPIATNAQNMRTRTVAVRVRS